MPIEIDTEAEAEAFLAEKEGAAVDENEGDEGADESAEVAAEEAGDVETVEAKDGEEADEEAEIEEEEVAEEPPVVAELRVEVEKFKGEAEELKKSRQVLVNDLSDGFRREERYEEMIADATEELAAMKALLQKAGIEEDPRDRELRLLRREQAKFSNRGKRDEESQKLADQARKEASRKVAMARVDGAAQAAGVSPELFRVKYLHEIQLAQVEKRKPLDPETFAATLAPKPPAKKAPKPMRPGKGAGLGSFPLTPEGDIAFIESLRSGGG